MKIFYLILFGFLVAVSGCSSESLLVKKYKNVYEPVKQDGITSYYIAGIPFGAFGTDKYSVIFSLQPTSIEKDEYLSLWVLYKNLDDAEYLLEPARLVKMNLSSKGAKINSINPSSPLAILNEIEKSKQADLVTTAITGALKSITYKSEVGKELSSQNTDRKILDIESWYNLYAESISNGILRKNTIFKDKSVNGLIYFYSPYPKEEPLIIHGQTYKQGKVFDFNDFDISIDVQLPDGSKEIKFIRMAGE